MHEWKQESKDGEQPDLEERLAAYYGPQLREQPLSSASWQRLRSQLGPQRPPRIWHMPHLRRFWRRNDYADPAYIRETFSRIMHEAHVSYPLSLLGCSFNTRMHVPTVHISAYGRHKIKLILPPTAKTLLNQSELDVLVAAGLARYLCMRSPRQRLVKILISPCPPACISSRYLIRVTSFSGSNHPSNHYALHIGTSAYAGTPTSVSCRCAGRAVVRASSCLPGIAYPGGS